jgi:hypothetical protein
MVRARFGPPTGTSFGHPTGTKCPRIQPRRGARALAQRLSAGKMEEMIPVPEGGPSARTLLNPGEPKGASVRRFVVAGGAARVAVIKAVGAQSQVEFGLAEHAVFFAPATCFGPLALDADDAAYGWFRGHGRSLVRPRQGRNVTEVTQRQVSGVRFQISGKATPCFGYRFPFGFPYT